LTAEREIVGIRIRGGGRDGIFLILESFLEPVDAFQQGLQHVCLRAAFLGDRICGEDQAM
jgi:hypothetical protein